MKKTSKFQFYFPALLGPKKIIKEKLLQLANMAPFGGQSFCPLGLGGPVKGSYLFGMTNIRNDITFFFYFSQAMHEANALTKRIFKYVFSVIFLSFLFTFTRFFEANVSYIDHDHNNLTEKIIALEPTEMRSNPIYTSYLNWSRLIVLGIIPFVLLVFLNASIYKVK